MDGGALYGENNNMSPRKYDIIDIMDHGAICKNHSACHVILMNGSDVIAHHRTMIAQKKLLYMLSSWKIVGVTSEVEEGEKWSLNSHRNKRNPEVV